MRRWDGTRIWYPNQKLGTMPLHNMSRSDAKVEIFKVCSLTHCLLGLFGQWLYCLHYINKDGASQLLETSGPCTSLGVGLPTQVGV